MIINRHTWTVSVWSKPVFYEGFSDVCVSVLYAECK